jgi:hypothetical protein
LTRHHHHIHHVVNSLGGGLNSSCGGSTQYVVVESESYPCLQSIPDLQDKVSSISMKVPVLGALEHRLGLMNSLHPELNSINKELESITNFDDMRAARAGGEIIKKHLDATTEGMNSSVHINTKSSATHNHWYNGQAPDAEQKARSEAIAEADTEKKIVRTVVKTEGKAAFESSIADTKAAEVTNAIASVAKEAEVVAANGHPEKAEAMVAAARTAAVAAAEAS